MGYDPNYNYPGSDEDEDMGEADEDDEEYGGDDGDGDETSWKVWGEGHLVLPQVRAVGEFCFHVALLLCVETPFLQRR